MRIIEPSYEITPFDSVEMMQATELAGRTCYKSEKKVTLNSAEQFVAALIHSGHESVLEHRSITVKFVVDRGVSHCLVRHRIAAFSQESTQYCNYSRDRFEGQVTFVRPVTFEKGSEDYALWYTHMEKCERAYLALIKEGNRTPQEARSVLPTSTKTELVMTCNLREWRHVFRMRTSCREQKQIRQVIVPLYRDLKKVMPFVFSGIKAYPWDYELRFAGKDKV